MLIPGIVDDTLTVGRIIVNGGLMAAGAVNDSEEDVSEFEDKNMLLIRLLKIRMLSRYKAKYCSHNAQ